MAIVLKVSAEQLMSASSAFQDQGSQLKACTDQMLQMISEITADVWSGDAASAYKTKFAGFANDMNRISMMIREHVSDLQEIARGYQEAEQQNQELSSALASDVIV